MWCMHHGKHSFVPDAWLTRNGSWFPVTLAPRLPSNTDASGDIHDWASCFEQMSMFCFAARCCSLCPCSLPKGTNVELEICRTFRTFVSIDFRNLCCNQDFEFFGKFRWNSWFATIDLESFSVLIGLLSSVWNDVKFM